MKYAFMKAHQVQFSIRSMCRMLKVHHSGFYAWLKSGLSKKARDDQRVTALIKQSWLESGCVYGYRKIHADLLQYLHDLCIAKAFVFHSKISFSLE